MTKVDEFIKHVGVKGMRWGVRTASSKNKPTSGDAKKAQKLLQKKKSSGIKSLTNNEIQNLNRRLQLEQQLSSLAPGSSLQRGLGFVREVLGAGRTMNEVVTFNNSPVGQSIRSHLSTSTD